MPNHVTNKGRAPSHVLQSLINESGEIDFNAVLPFRGQFPWDGISVRAETVAEAITGVPPSDNPLIASLQQMACADANVLQLDDECFEQFIQMLRNKRSCGYLHAMDFARDAWGDEVECLRPGFRY